MDWTHTHFKIITPGHEVSTVPWSHDIHADFQSQLKLTIIRFDWHSAHSSTHIHKAIKILFQAFVGLFVKPGKCSELVPLKLMFHRIKNNSKSRHHTIKISFFSSCPSSQGRSKRCEATGQMRVQTQFRSPKTPLVYSSKTKEQYGWHTSSNKI